MVTTVFGKSLLLKYVKRSSPSTHIIQLLFTLPYNCYRSFERISWVQATYYCFEVLVLDPKSWQNFSICVLYSHMSFMKLFGNHMSSIKIRSRPLTYHVMYTIFFEQTSMKLSISFKNSCKLTSTFRHRCNLDISIAFQTLHRHSQSSY